MQHMAQKPIVGVVPDNGTIKGRSMSLVLDQYLTALFAADMIPVIIAMDCLGDDLNGLLDRLDGICMTGSPSNIDPVHYNAPPEIENDLRDIKRDRLSFELIKATRDRRMPMMGICRGFQEINVALGGTLYQRLHDEDEFLDHRADPSQPHSVQFSSAHRVAVEPDGFLASMDGEKSFKVNSLHGQGIKNLASDLRIEARAPDGLIEAFSLPPREGFLLAVQWHPEILSDDMPLNGYIYEQFRAACTEYGALNARL